MLKRNDCAKIVAEWLREDDLVVCGLGATEAAFAAAGPPCPTYFASDPMGVWSSVGLGLALARPDRRVTLLAGDGDLLMSLQSLAMIASAGAANYRIVVFQNGAYASTGGQRLAGERLSFAKVAEAVGFGSAAEAADEAELRRGLAALFGRDGPALLAVHLQDEPCPAAPAGPWSQVEVRTRFLDAVAALDRNAMSTSDGEELR